MKTLVVFESSWGHTEQIARAVAEGLGVGARAVHVQDTVPGDLRELDLLVVGGPAPAFSIDEPVGAPAEEGTGIRNWLAALPEDLVVPAATFETRVRVSDALPGPPATAAGRELPGHLRDQTIRSSVFHLHDISGPVVEGELERARAWGQHLAAAHRSRRG